MPPTLSPREFVARWRNSTLKERQGYQQHFSDLCALVGEPPPAEQDPAGLSFTFEKGVSKSAGGSGWADVWKRGYFAWEYKGPDGDLKAAYQQLLQYRESLENPPLLIVSTWSEIQIHPNFVNAVNRTVTITLDDLLTPDGMARLRAVFFNPAFYQAALTKDDVTKEAAAEFAHLALLLVRWGADPHAVAHFLIRILFCLFAEDVDLLPGCVFTRLVTQALRRPALFKSQLAQLFAAMTRGDSFGVDEIRNFDGGLFDDASVLDLDGDALDILARVSTLDWSSVKPSIFGTLFERSLDPSKRSQLGAHYTGEDDILLIVEPVLMAPLRRRWAEVAAAAQALAARRDAARGAQRTRLSNELYALLRGFRNELAAMRVLDAACGSGNFLYISLRLLLDLEKEVINLAEMLGDSRSFPLVSPEQLYGIEINPYAHELAQVTVWIGYIQWLRENGFGEPSEPILKPLRNIQLMDAILAHDDQGRPVEPEWPEAYAIIGNPPFLGGKRLRTELGDEYVDDLFRLYEGRVSHEADLVCYWFEKARTQIVDGTAKRSGLLATQGIHGGANRKVLERIRAIGGIFWAQSDRNWILNGATVHVSMIGFDNGADASRVLNDRPVAAINSDLTAAADLNLAKRLSENGNLSFMGVTPAGSFDVSEEQARAWLADRGNPNGRPNADVLRPYYNGKDLTTRPSNRWIIDFGTDMPLEQASQYEAPFEYVRKVVKPERLKGRVPAGDPWWLFTRPRPTMRSALQALLRYIAAPMVAKHHIFAWVPTAVVPANLLIVIARDDDYMFGVVHSRSHELWARSTGSQLREASSGHRYTPTTTFETYPFPWPPGREPAGDALVAAIAAAARDLVAKRDAWLNPPDASEAELKKRTLTNLYNQRPTWLDLAHRALDEAVFAAYGWPAKLTDDEILTRLLALNLARASTQRGK